MNGRSNYRNKATFSNFSGVVSRWMLPNFKGFLMGAKVMNKAGKQLLM